MRRGILKSFFSSGLQAIAVQVLGVLFIAVVAKILPKEEFGIIQWANVTAMFITTMLSFGMEQVVVRRIAASAVSDWAAAAFLVHNLVGSVLAFGITLLTAFLLPDPNGASQYLPLFFAAQAIIFLVTPLKQFLNAKHIFAPYGIVAVISNTLKLVLAYLLIKNGSFNIVSTGIVLLTCASIELVAIFIYVRTKTSFRLRFRFIAYKKLLKESMPQYLAVVFDSSLSRLDMMLLGIIGGSYVAMGEYGFAYRAFEMARLPVVVIAPIILNIFSRMFMSGNKLTKDKQHIIKQLYSLEMFFAVLIPLVLNILWSPLMDDFFDYKYGTANATEFMLLSICIPLHFFINLLWTISFANKKYKKIASLTMIVAVTNLVLNLILIPYYGGVGAAIAFILTTALQAYLYYTVVKRQVMSIPLFILLRFLLAASIIYIFVQLLPIHFVCRLLLAIALYVVTCYVFKLASMEHYKELRKYLAK